MGCGTVTHKQNPLQEKKIALKPYPDDINGINDKVANSFNIFLKSHGANPKPAYKERPKLCFEMKESKPSKNQSFIVSNNLRTANPEDINNLVQNFSESDLLASISEKKSAEESVSKAEEKTFFINVPAEGSPGPEQVEKRLVRFSISFNAEKDMEELNELENEANTIISKYISK